MATRRVQSPRGRIWRGPQLLDRREARVRGVTLPGEHQLDVTTPNLAELRQGAGIADQQAEALLKEQHLGLATLRALEAGEAVPRIVCSRVTAALGISHAQAKGELA
jgi:hypothetical protein